MHPPVLRAIEWTWLKRKAEHKTADKGNRVAREREQTRGRMTERTRWREGMKARGEQ